MATPNTELVRSIYEALGRGDVAAAMEALDPDVEWIEPDMPGLPFAGVHHGRDAVLSRVFAASRALWDEFRVQPEEFIGCGEAVVVIGRFRASAGDRRLDAPFAHVWRVRAGFAAELRNFTDTAAFAAALDLPAPTPAH